MMCFEFLTNIVERKILYFSTKHAILSLSNFCISQEKFSPEFPKNDEKENKKLRKEGYVEA